MLTETLTKKNGNDLFGLCSEISEIFRKRGFQVSVYPEHLDGMDSFDKTNLNMIVYGSVGEKKDFLDIINLLAKKSKRVSQSTRYTKLDGGESIDDYCLFEIGGKRIKIRDRILVDQ